MADSVIVHGDGRGASVDDIAKAVVFITSDHHEIHKANYYTVSGQTTLGSSDTFKILIVSPAKKWANLVVKIRSSGEANYGLYEGTTYSSAGAATTEINHNRTSSNTAETVVTTAPTTSGNGTLLFEAHFGSGVRSGGEERTDEWVLANSTAYMVLITSEASANDVSYILQWYEETP